MSGDVPLQDGAFYARRYILSSCMNWNDCLLLRSEGSKPSAWKKGKIDEVRIHPSSWKLEFKNDKDSWEKSQIVSLTVEETKDPGEKICYIVITLEKNQFLSISGKREFVNMFHCGLLLFLERPEVVDLPLMQAKTAEFEHMVANLRKFLANSSVDAVPPPIPPLPANLDFVDPIVNPA
jgi:hypothetical protein